MSPIYRRESVAQVKDAVDMLDLVNDRTELRRAGGRYTGLCPFHDERTPSLSVDADHKLYYCFGCGASGDAIGFVQASEGLEFTAALEYLAQRYGVELVPEDEDPQAEAGRKRRQRMLELAQRTATFYARYLWEAREAEPARRYLKERGLGEEVLKSFTVGFAPQGGDRVVSSALDDGFSVEEVVSAGLGATNRQGRLYDRFRGRITFPLCDSRGRVLGFGARAMEGQTPKYLNTSDNELYHKGSHVFGMDHARSAATKAQQIIVVEGYTDVLALHQAGIGETVAIMGTALTTGQLTELSRAASTVYLALDADSAGQNAMLRAAQLATQRGVELRIAVVGEDSDPADFVLTEGAGALRKRLESAVGVPEFEVRRVLESSDLQSARGRDRALEQVRPLLATLPTNSVTQDELVRYVADKLNVPAEYLMTQTLAGRASDHPAAEQGASYQAPSETTSQSSVDVLTRAERAFFALALARGESGRSYLQRVSDEHLSSQVVCDARDWLLAHFAEPLAELDTQQPFSDIVTEAALRADSEPSSDETLEMSFLQLELRRIERQLRSAEQAGAFDTQRELWAGREQVRARIGDLMGSDE